MIRPLMTAAAVVAAMLTVASDPTAGQEPVRIALLPDHQVHGQRAKLSELAEIRGGEASVRDRVSQVEIELTRRGSAKTSLTRHEVLAELLVAGVPSRQFELIGPQEVPLRPAPTVDAATLFRQAIVRHISGGLDLPEQHIDVILNVSAAQWRDLAGQLTRRTTARPLQHADRLIGSRMIEIGLFHEDRLVDTVHVRATTSIRREVLVTSRPVERGEKLDESNTFIELRRFDRFDADAIPPERLLNQTVTRRLRAQQLVRHIDVGTARQNQPREEPLIRPRDMVNVVLQKGGLRITLSGAEALRAGRRGDIIPLLNPTSRERIYGRVIDKNLVQLEF